MFFWKSASVSLRECLDSSLSRLTWFVHHAENLFLETDLRLETILNNEEKRRRTKKLDSIFWSLKCSIPMNHDRTHYIPMNHDRTHHMNTRGNWLPHRPVMHILCIQMMGAKWKLKHRRLFLSLGPQHFSFIGKTITIFLLGTVHGKHWDLRETCRMNSCWHLLGKNRKNPKLW